MNLSTVLLLCAIIAGLAGGAAARYRRWGTAPGDLATGALVAGLLSTVTAVVLTLAAGLDTFGLMHLAYLLIVVAFPLATVLIVVPQLIDAERRTPILGRLMLIAAIASVAVGVWATHVEPFRLQVDTQIIGATGSTTPIVVGVIADLQTTAITEYEDAALDAILGGSPDLVVIAGDLFQLDEFDLPDRIPEFLGWLRRLTNEVDTVVIVAGNVDRADVVSDLADEAGAIYLENEIAELEIGTQRLVIAGIYRNEEMTPSDIDPIMLETLNATTTESDLVLALSHYPDPVLNYDANTTIDLTIAGHTHGGQVALPRFGPLITYTDVPNVVAAGGLHVLNGNPVYVSTGVGLERAQAPQLRFGVPPSVALITIVP